VGENRGQLSAGPVVLTPAAAPMATVTTPVPAATTEVEANAGPVVGAVRVATVIAARHSTMEVSVVTPAAAIAIMHLVNRRALSCCGFQVDAGARCGVCRGYTKKHGAGAR
jgi:hypothetical protein